MTNEPEHIIDPKLDDAALDTFLTSKDVLELQSLFSRLQEKQLSSEVELSPLECRAAITITRILRRTNTGPAKAKKPRKTTEVTDADLDALMKMDI